MVLCIGDFFGPVKEDGTTDNQEVAQLLNGDIVGTLVCLVPPVLYVDQTFLVQLR